MKNIFLPLILSVIIFSARAEAPKWEVKDDGKYSSNMTVVATAEIDGVLNNNPNSHMAAFIDGVCRGEIQAIPMGTAYFFINVFGNQEDNGKEVYFRIYDATTDEVYGVNQSFTFTLNGSKGDFVNPEKAVASFKHSDYLLTKFDTENQVMETEISGNTIRVYHDAQNDLSATHEWFESPATKYTLQKEGAGILTSGVSTLNLHQNNYLLLYTENNVLVERYFVDVVYAFATPAQKLSTQNIKLYRNASGICMEAPQQTQLQSCHVYSLSGALLSSHNTQGNQAIINAPQQVVIIELHYLDSNGQVKKLCRKL